MSFYTRSFSLLLLVIILTATEAKKCPPESTIEPCECNEVNPTSDIKLVNFFCPIDHVQILLNVISSSGDHPFPMLTLGGHFSYVPALALKRKSVQQLYITHSTLVGMFDRVPESNQKLQGIHVERTKILRGVEWELFKNFHNLVELFFQEVPIKSLGKEFMDNVPPSITDLQLIFTNITRLGDEVFSKLTNIKQISVIYGRLTSLKRSMFPRTNIITDLRFDGHMFENFPDDLFNDMPQLKIVSFSHNRLKTLPEIIFGNFKERNIEIQFYGNEIVCDCSIRWVIIKGWTPAGACAKPESLKDREVHSVGSDLDYCDDV